MPAIENSDKEVGWFVISGFRTPTAAELAPVLPNTQLWTGSAPCRICYCPNPDLSESAGAFVTWMLAESPAHRSSAHQSTSASRAAAGWLSPPPPLISELVGAARAEAELGSVLCDYELAYSQFTFQVGGQRADTVRFSRGTNPVTPLSL